MMDKYLSIITNFGCHYTCPYCIVRENNLHIPKTTLKGLDKLEDAIKENGCNWVSISGGGDPLFNIEKHIDWYAKLDKNIPFKIKLELHTSYIKSEVAPLFMFNRIVYHIRKISDVREIKKANFYDFENQIVRVVFVVDESFTEDKIDMIVQEVKHNNMIDELSFRQMIDSNYKETNYCKEYLEQGHKKDWYYITQGDYNLYYCEGKVSTKYEDFKEENTCQ